MEQVNGYLRYTKEELDLAARASARIALGHVKNAQAKSMDHAQAHCLGWAIWNMESSAHQLFQANGDERMNAAIKMGIEAAKVCREHREFAEGFRWITNAIYAVIGFPEEKYPEPTAAEIDHALAFIEAGLGF